MHIRERDCIRYTLRLTELEVAKYGIQINESQFEFLAFGKADGARVQPNDEVKYPGCSLNNMMSAGGELQTQMSDCRMILKKLDLFWHQISFLGSL